MVTRCVIIVHAFNPLILVNSVGIHEILCRGGNWSGLGFFIVFPSLTCYLSDAVLKSWRNSFFNCLEVLGLGPGFHSHERTDILVLYVLTLKMFKPGLVYVGAMGLKISLNPCKCLAKFGSSLASLSHLHPYFFSV